MAACRGMGDQNMNDKRKDKVAILTIMGRIEGGARKSTASEGYGQEKG